jgi:hypothetical protein
MHNRSHLPTCFTPETTEQIFMKFGILGSLLKVSEEI